MELGSVLVSREPSLSPCRGQPCYGAPHLQQRGRLGVCGEDDGHRKNRTRPAAWATLSAAVPDSGMSVRLSSVYVGRGRPRSLMRSPVSRSDAKWSGREA